MTILASRIDTAAPEFRVNAGRMRALVAELAQRRAEAAAGGPARARERHLARGKLLPRDRVMALIDPGAPFLELSPLAANGLYDGAIHAAGLITGIGRVEGRECMIVANDSTIKGGTYYPMTVKKHLRAQEPAALHLSRRLRRRQPAAPDRGVSRSRTFRPHLLQSGDAVGAGHRADRGGDGVMHGWRRLCAGDVGRDHHRPQPARWCRRRSWGAPTCMRGARASPITTRATTVMRWRLRAGSSPISIPGRSSTFRCSSRASRRSRPTSSTASSRSTSGSNTTCAR